MLYTRLNSSKHLDVCVSWASEHHPPLEDGEKVSHGQWSRL